MTNIAVAIGECRCPGTPHKGGDEAFLAPVPPLALGIATFEAIRTAGDEATALEVALGRAFVRYGVVDWTLVDEEGQKIPITPAEIDERLTWGEGGLEVYEKAVELYKDRVIAPLVRRLQTTSPSGPTTDSTSPTQPSSPPPPSSSPSSSPESSETPIESSPTSV